MPDTERSEGLAERLDEIEKWGPVNGYQQTAGEAAAEIRRLTAEVEDYARRAVMAERARAEDARDHLGDAELWISARQRLEAENAKLREALKSALTES